MLEPEKIKQNFQHGSMVFRYYYHHQSIKCYCNSCLCGPYLAFLTYREACRGVGRGRCGSEFHPSGQCSFPLWSTGRLPHTGPSLSFYGTFGLP